MNDILQQTVLREKVDSGLNVNLSNPNNDQDCQDSHNQNISNNQDTNQISVNSDMSSNPQESADR